MKNSIRTTEIRSSKQKLTILKEIQQGNRSQSFNSSKSPQKTSPLKQSPQKLSSLKQMKQGVFFNAQGPAKQMMRPNSKYIPGVKSNTRINEQLSMHKKITSETQLPKLSPIKPKYISLKKRNEIKLDLFRQYEIVEQVAFKTQAGRNSQRMSKINQDSYLSMEQFGDKSSLFGVFDGHGQDGHRCSKYLRDALPSDYIIIIGLLKKELQAGTAINEALQNAFMRTNKELCQDFNAMTQFSGSTSVLTLIVDRTVYCANVGDSRAVIGRKQNGYIQTISLSNDHKPDLPQEKYRIEKHGGLVEQMRDEDGSQAGPYRVWLSNGQVPGLAMSRSFGDQIAAQVGVIAEPEIICHQLSNSDLFMVLASDGVWEFLSNEKVVEMILPYYVREDPLEACEKILKESTKQWMQNDQVIDDITCLIIFFDRDQN